MKGIIIAAGTSSRMGSLTRDRPKCMLPVMGRPLLDWTMERLRAAGCDEIVVVNQGRYGEAEPLYKRSLAIKKKALGPDHPSVATSLDNLGVLYEAQGRYGERDVTYGYITAESARKDYGLA